MAAEDALIRRVFAFCLVREQANPNSDPPVLHLEKFAEALVTDAMGQEPAMLLDQNNVDGAVVSRLIEDPPSSYPLPPLQYLMGCYARASTEIRAKATQDSPQLMAAVQACRELIVSYAGLLLVANILPQPPEAEARGALQLLDSIDAQVKGPSAGVVPLPHGFLDELATKYETEGIDEVIRPIIKELARRVKQTSPLGDYSAPLNAISALCRIEPLARVMTSVREWLPNLKDVTGRGIELPGSSWLGPAFCCSPLSDRLVNSQPNVAMQCFGDYESRRQGDMVQSMTALRMASKQIQTELHTIVKNLLGKSTRPAMLDWLSAVIEGNMERAKMNPDVEKAASDGFFVNLNAVMLKLCGPFLDPSNPNFWKRVDARYVAANPRLSFQGETKLAMTEAEDTAWTERVTSSLTATSSGSSEAAVVPEYHFICDCFFLTLKALHLGVAKVVTSFSDSARQLQSLVQQEAALQRELESLPTGSRRHAEITMMLQRISVYVKAAKAERLCVDTILGDPDLMGDVLSFYRLVASWMLCTAYPASRGNASAVQLPLPDTPPPEFASLPEYFVVDMAEVILHVSRYFPHILSAAKMDETMLFLTVFIGSPKYVRSSHLRSKLSEIVHVWMPQAEEGAQRRRTGPMDSTITYLLQGHPMVVGHLVPSLLQLYVDVEFTDRANQFYMKFNMRQYIGDILHYLWDIPSHRAVWREYAKTEGSDSGAYVRFANMLISDAIYLLDEALKKIQDVKEKDTLMADSTRWAELGPQEQQEARSEHSSTGDQLRSLLYLAQGTISTLNFSTLEVTGPFLLPAMVDRVAGMLNYFLKYLTGSERRRLAIKEPEKYNFKPRELLMNIIQVYLHLFAADRDGLLAAAVGTDARSYSPQMFPEAIKVLSSSGMLSPGDMAQLEALMRRVSEAESRDREQEDLMRDIDIPSEFLDPIIMTLMSDPVLLPTGSKLIMDRPQITRHLLGDQRDPITREPLTPEMLIPQPELKARIQAWIKEINAAKPES